MGSGFVLGRRCGRVAGMNFGAINYGIVWRRREWARIYQDSVVTFFFRFRRRAAAVLMARASLGLT